MEYHKIKNVFKRELEGRKFIKQFAVPEFEFLSKNQWIATEKIDGTNVRIIWDGVSSYIRGKKDTSEMPVFLYEKLMKIKDGIDFAAVFGTKKVILYGEGFGYRINEGYEKLGKTQNFILFDILIEGHFASMSLVQELAKAMNVSSVPMIFAGNLFDCIEFARTGFMSTYRASGAEGLIAKPAVELATRYNERIIVKLKTKDLQNNLWSNYNGL